MLIAATLLAGGHSRRMGQPKALLDYDGRPLIEHLAEQLKRQLPAGTPLFVSGCPEPGLYRHLSLPVVTDVIADGGPLGGLYTALRHSTQQSPAVEAVLAMPCDGTRLPPQFVAKMLAALGRHELVFARDSEREQQLYCALRTSLQAPLLAYLNSGRRKVIDWFESRDYAVVDFSDRGFCFSNFNTPEDWHSR